MTTVPRNQVFISYSHEDKEWLEKLRTMLKPLERAGRLTVWADTEIDTGKQWRREIEDALARAKVAVLLVTPDFLASDFIDEHELPPLLNAQREGLMVVWIPVKASMYEETEIADYQATHDPARPLEELSPPELNKALVAICKKIKEKAAKPGVGVLELSVPSANRRDAPAPRTLDQTMIKARLTRTTSHSTLPLVFDISLVEAQHLQRQAAKALNRNHFFSDPFLDGSGQGPEMAVIPPGRFWLGSPQAESDRKSNEGPWCEVCIEAPFAIARFLVSVAEFQRACEWSHALPRGLKATTCPCFGVSWDMANIHAQWLSEQTGQHYRLPSEAEWEYAARAGTATRYSFGDEVDQGQVSFGPKGKLVAVGDLPSNPWGLFEMHGNLWEWTADGWHGSYAGHSGTASPWPGGGQNFVLRGGSWQTPIHIARSASRTFTSPSTADETFGFRLVREFSD